MSPFHTGNSDVNLSRDWYQLNKTAWLNREVVKEVLLQWTSLHGMGEGSA